jgi:hypothetical protein
MTTDIFKETRKSLRIKREVKKLDKQMEDYLKLRDKFRIKRKYD